MSPNANSIRRKASNFLSNQYSRQNTPNHFFSVFNHPPIDHGMDPGSRCACPG
ncbi:hypothetical protein TRICHSKD4_3625 [Roseibium sp. TrichSKD4]|nr:hypothetical protein TRICHSKD4_3625 [Roseibium sp. TrichSKD4]